MQGFRGVGFEWDMVILATSTLDKCSLDISCSGILVPTPTCIIFGVVMSHERRIAQERVSNHIDLAHLRPSSMSFSCIKCECEIH